VTYVIAQPCVDVKDKACIEECPVDCIYEEDDVPEQWSEYYKANVEFFDDLGSPGGAAKLGMIEKDHPIIATLPLQVHGD
jgi:NAD-dependent dihydropyrimidine dehydrogenase PreA subunit